MAEAVVLIGRRGRLFRSLRSRTWGAVEEEYDSLNGAEARRANPLDAADWSSVTMSTGSWLSPTEGSTTSEKEIVESVGVAPPKKCAGGPSCASSPGRVVATTATRDISAGAGTDCSPSPVVEGLVGFAGAAATLVRALTIGAIPLMPRPARAYPIRPFGVVPGPVESSCSSSGSVLGGGR
jgi:hypothetical protein